MRRAIACAAALLFCGLNANAAPIMPAPQVREVALQTQRAKIICEESGFCFRVPVRRPVARWVYGDSIFYPDYVGPNNYGNPRWRRNWARWW